MAKWSQLTYRGQLHSHQITLITVHPHNQISMVISWHPDKEFTANPYEQAHSLKQQFMIIFNTLIKKGEYYTLQRL